MKQRIINGLDGRIEYLENALPEIEELRKNEDWTKLRSAFEATYRIMNHAALDVTDILIEEEKDEKAE